MEPLDLTGVKEYASEIAQPREPVVPGCSASIFLPTSVSIEGLGVTEAP